MFNNIDKKIKKLAEVLCWLGIVIWAIFGIVYWVEAGEFFGGFLIIGLGVLISWVSSFLLYGFGQLIENTEEIKKNTLEIDNNTFSNKSNISEDVVHASKSAEEGSNL